jgi:hypothetical protein
LPALANAADEHAHHRETIARNDPPIKITINAEARVSVTLAGSPVRCGSPADLSVKVVNQGFVTSRLEATLVGDVPAEVTLEFHPEPLLGVPDELRSLRIILTSPGPTDLTIAFRSHNNAPDLGGRDRVHFLMECVPDQAGSSTMMETTNIASSIGAMETSHIVHLTAADRSHEAWADAKGKYSREHRRASREVRS